MNWDAVGALAELAGATGVIVSFVYLGLQIRQNTRSVRASSYHAVTTNLSNLSGSIGRDASASALLFRGQTQLEALDSDERARFSILMISLFRCYENIFYQFNQEMLDRSVWSGWENSMTRTFWNPGVQIWWPTWRNDCHREFRDFLESSTAPEVDARALQFIDGAKEVGS
jgi:hypothetical protein